MNKNYGEVYFFHCKGHFHCKTIVTNIYTFALITFLCFYPKIKEKHMQQNRQLRNLSSMTASIAAINVYILFSCPNKKLHIFFRPSQYFKLYLPPQVARIYEWRCRPNWEKGPPFKPWECPPYLILFWELPLGGG